jgi:hypothetical protein
MSKVETAAEKTARLRALRYAVQGSPDEKRAAKKAVKEALTRANNARAAAFWGTLGKAVRQNPDAVAANLEAVGRTAESLTRTANRIKNY